MNINYKVRRQGIFIIIFFIVLLQLFMRVISDIKSNDFLGDKIYSAALDHGIALYHPYSLYVRGKWEKRNVAEKIMYQFYKDMPLEMCMIKKNDNDVYLTEYMQQPVSDSYAAAVDIQNNSDISAGDLVRDNAYQELEQAVLAENTAATGTFIPVRSPVVQYSRQQLCDTGFIREAFYSVDATTQVKGEQLQYDTLMGFDASLKQDNSNVQILVYHTHSQETYIDSVEGDSSTSIVGVGEHLCNILRTQYGFNVLHHTGEYDVESRDYAYSNAMAGLDKVLAENPSIEVMIDLHRDQTNADTRLVTTIQNKTMAKFMFFNGLCYTRELGTLNNLPNPYVQDNLSLSFQMQLAAEEFYPGLTRRIYLKGYRYNLHYRPKSMLIELGSQTNTVEEAMNSCDPLAHIIAMVLNGENKE
ncbi:MAG: stage II sporulation protein P [Lachnospiraceae bacterium]|nr:stage II sporulation protein P [Lachnospiraceae bacterium]